MPSKDINVNLEDAGAGDILLKPNGASATVATVNGDGTGLPMVKNDESPTLLETAEERKLRKRSHYVVYFTTFIGSVGFSIVLTGVWPYLQQLDPGVSKDFLGWVIAANPFGQMLASPVMGLWANKAGSSRAPLLFTIAIFILGNALYAILNIFGEASRAVMVVSRFLVGVSFANMAVIRSYVAASTTTKERTTAVALTSAAQGFGFIIGPGLQAAIAVAFSKEAASSSNSSMPNNISEPIFEEDYSSVRWDMYTAAGWTGAFLGLVNFFIFLPCIFKEQPIAAKEAQLQRNILNENDKKLPKPDYKTVIALLFTFFITQFVFVLLEVMLVPMCIDMYAWTDETALTVIGVGMCLAGIVATIMFGLAGPLTKRFDERKVYILLGLVPILISMLSLIPMGNTYPKIQNCTLETEDHHPREERSVSSALPYHLEVVKSQLQPLVYKRDMENIWNLDLDYDEALRENVNVGVIPVSGYQQDVLLYNQADLPDHVLLRRRRGIHRAKKCHDLGCPPEQEWCKYTPIIEKSQMIVGCLVAFIGYPIAFTLSNSLYSKLLGPKPQGLWQGILTSTGSFSRVTGPIFVTYMYAELGTRWTFGLLFVVMVFTTIITLIYYKRLVPMKVTST